MIKPLTLVLAASAAMIAAGVPLFNTAWAAEKPVVGDTSALKTMLDCRKLPTKDARADCYDAAVDALARQAFGCSLPSLNLLTKGLKEEPLTAVTMKLAGAHDDRDSYWVMETTEQVVWRQTQSSGYPLTPHSGSTLTIRPGILGAFFCQVDDQVQFRCRRER